MVDFMLQKGIRKKVDDLIKDACSTHEAILNDRELLVFIANIQENSQIHTRYTIEEITEDENAEVNNKHADHNTCITRIKSIITSKLENTRLKHNVQQNNRKHNGSSSHHGMY